MISTKMSKYKESNRYLTNDISYGGAGEAAN